MAIELRNVDLGGIVIDQLRCDGGTQWHGQVSLFGLPHHVLLLKVTDEIEAGDPDVHFQVPVDDPDDWYSNFQGFNEGRLIPVTVPGLEGEFLLAIYPFAE